MDLIWGIAAIGIFLGIIGLLTWDVMDQIRSRRYGWKIIERKGTNHHKQKRF